MLTVLKIKSGKIAERSPYFRELLFFARYTLAYGGDEEFLHRLEVAFRDPAYPLSLGREDERAPVEEVTLDEASAGEARFRGTVLPGDIRLQEGAIFEPPVVERLPFGFTVDGKGIRHPERTVTLADTESEQGLGQLERPPDHPAGVESPGGCRKSPSPRCPRT